VSPMYYTPALIYCYGNARLKTGPSEPLLILSFIYSSMYLSGSPQPSWDQQHHITVSVGLRWTDVSQEAVSHGLLRRERERELRQRRRGTAEGVCPVESCGAGGRYLRPCIRADAKCEVYDSVLWGMVGVLRLTRGAAWCCTGGSRIMTFGGCQEAPGKLISFRSLYKNKLTTLPATVFSNLTALQIL
jgi:hypothetical protein